MNAATVVSAAVQSTPDLRATLRKELSQLHILLLGAKADLEDVLGPVPCRRTATELKQELKKAVVFLDAIRARIEDG
jgi:hypothetical protein